VYIDSKNQFHGKSRIIFSLYKKYFKKELCLYKLCGVKVVQFAKVTEQGDGKVSVKYRYNLSSSSRFFWIKNQPLFLSTWLFGK